MWKEEILRQSYDNPVEYKGGKVMIMRELSRQVIAQRKTFKELTEKLKKKKCKIQVGDPIGCKFCL